MSQNQDPNDNNKLTDEDYLELADDIIEAANLEASQNNIFGNISDDDWLRKVESAFKEVFGDDVEILDEDIE